MESSFFQFHEHPVVISWWMQTFDKPLRWLDVARRRQLLMYAALIISVITPWVILHDKGQPFRLVIDGLTLFLVIALLAMWCFGVFYVAKHLKSTPVWIQRHPLISLHASYWLVVALTCQFLIVDSVLVRSLYGLSIMMPIILWRLSYLTLAGQHGRLKESHLEEHLFYLWPAFGGNGTPYGKGIVYLTQCEAKTVEALARSQLAGIRLLLLGILWGLTLYLFEGVFYGDGNHLTRWLNIQALPIPPLGELVKNGEKAALAVSWIAVYCEFFKQVLRHAAGGHVVVAMLRLYGFYVFRNTYKPLFAESITEFWNRYFYYFKELLSNFFFMPVFTSWAKGLQGWPKIRLGVSVFAAAFVGNMYYHIIEHSVNIANGQLLHTLDKLSGRFVYCFMLATGIYVSMLREQSRPVGSAVSPTWERYLNRMGVWLFFSLIFIWDVRSKATLEQRTSFFFGLIGAV